jgi:sugar lactone lactonase YvrE
VKITAVVAAFAVIIAAVAWLFVAQREAARGRGVLPGGVTRVVAGKPGQELNTPLDVAVAPNGQTYVADSGNGRVQVFSRWGRPLGLLGREEEVFTYPNTVAVDAYGNVYIGEFTVERIRVFTPKGNLVRTIDEKSAGVRIAPLDMAVGADGDLLIADRWGAVTILDSQGQVRKRIDRIDGALPATMSYPNGIAGDTRGRIVVADSGNGRLLLLNPEGELVRVITHGKMTHPRGVAFFDNKHIVTADTFNNRLLVFDVAGRLVKTLQATDQPGLAYMMPNGLCVFEKRLFVADRAHNVVIVFGREAH